MFAGDCRSRGEPVPARTYKGTLIVYLTLLVLFHVSWCWTYPPSDFLLFRYLWRRFYTSGWKINGAVHKHGPQWPFRGIFEALSVDATFVSLSRKLLSSSPISGATRPGMCIEYAVICEFEMINQTNVALFRLQEVLQETEAILHSILGNHDDNKKHH